MNRIIIKYYHALFALKTQNCLDNFTLIITALSIVFGLMNQEFTFVLIQLTVYLEITFNEDLCHVETSQLILIAKQLFGFYMAQDMTEGNFRTFYGFLDVTLFAHLFLIDRINVYGITFLFNLLFNCCSGMCKI